MLVLGCTDQSKKTRSANPLQSNGIQRHSNVIYKLAVSERVLCVCPFARGMVYPFRPATSALNLVSSTTKIMPSSCLALDRPWAHGTKLLLQLGFHCRRLSSL